MARYAIAQLDEIGELDDGRCPYRPVRHHFGIGSFGATAWTGREVGDRIVNEHDEDDGDGPGHEELYLVHTGSAVFEIDGERVNAPAGTFVFIPPGAKRTAFAEEAGTTIVVVGGAPGHAYEPMGWELWMPLGRLYEAGDYAAVVEQGREAIEASPRYPILFYNLACCESLTGRTADAIEHLRRAIELSERFRTLAKDDTDLDAIRDEPAFRELVGA